MFRKNRFFIPALGLLALGLAAPGWAPHFKTFDSLRYHIYSTGEYHFYQHPSDADATARITRFALDCRRGQECEIFWTDRRYSPPGVLQAIRLTHLDIPDRTTEWDQVVIEPDADGATFAFNRLVNTDSTHPFVFASGDVPIADCDMQLDLVVALDESTSIADDESAAITSIFLDSCQHFTFETDDGYLALTRWDGADDEALNVGLHVVFDEPEDGPWTPIARLAFGSLDDIFWLEVDRPADPDASLRQLIEAATADQAPDQDGIRGDLLAAPARFTGHSIARGASPREFVERLTFEVDELLWDED